MTEHLQTPAPFADDISSPEIIAILAAIAPDSDVKISASDSKRLLLATARLAAQQERELRALRTPARASYGDILDVDNWASILTSPVEADRAANWLEEFFCRALGPRAPQQSLGLAKILRSLLVLGATNPSILPAEPFKAAARVAMAEMVCADEAVRGMKPVALTAMRRNFTEGSLPDKYLQALDSARAIDKLTQDTRSQPSAKEDDFHKKSGP